MSYRTRKLRRRSQAFPGDDETPAIADAEVQPLQNMEDSQSNGSEDLSDEHRKEDEVWNAFKEENHEGNTLWHIAWSFITRCSSRTTAPVSPPTAETHPRTGRPK